MENNGNSPNLTPLSSLGEFGLIELLTKHIELYQESTEQGVGDDCAVILPPDGQRLLVTTDMLVEGVHFDLGYVPLKHLGYKSVVVNLSDVYAMGGRPTQIVISVAMSNRFTVEAIEELYEGIRSACKFYKVDLVGGDTTTSPSGLTLSITALGWSNMSPILRSTANQHDLLVVSGDLGGAYMGLQVLEREKAVYQVNPNMQPQLDNYTYILERQLKPEARRDIIDLMDKLELQPTSMIDISDGLSSEILHLCHESGLGAVVYEDRLPISGEVIEVCGEFDLDPLVPVMNGGEDYELLFTIALEDYDKVKGNPDLTVIGHMTAKGEKALLSAKDGQLHELTAQGWDALKKNS
jgi:thiamine-monophosphate kinase